MSDYNKDYDNYNNEFSGNNLGGNDPDDNINRTGKTKDAEDQSFSAGSYENTQGSESKADMYSQADFSVTDGNAGTEELASNKAAEKNEQSAVEADFNNTADADNPQSTAEDTNNNYSYYGKFNGSAYSSAGEGTKSYTTSSESSGTASYEWNNGEYSGKYSTDRSSENRDGSFYSSGSYGYGSQPRESYSNQQTNGYSGSSYYNSQNSSYSSYNGSNYGGGSHYGSGYGSSSGGQSYSQGNASGGYYNNSYVNPSAKAQKQPKPKKEKKQGSVSAVVLAICILASGVLGFGGGMLANYMNGSSSGGSGMTINKVVTTADEASAVTGDMSTSDIVKATKNSVVEITTEIVTTGDFLQQYIESGAGSGVIISENGYIITNNHVIEDASSITVTLADGSSYSAELVGRDSELDVALIKIDATGLDPAEIGDSSSIEIGDKTVVIGNPLGQLGGSVTDGIISAVNRNVMIDGVSHNVIQTNAAINPGNSGGGMFNGKGELIGLIVAKSVDESVEGIGFAIPINDVSDILEDLMEYGYVRGKVSLGMSFVDISNAQTALMYRVSELGCYVSSVEINSNAANAGFQSGDLITSVNGTSVSSSSDIESVIEKLSVGDTVEFTVKRNGRTGTLSLVLEEAVPDGIASQNDESQSNGIRDNFGNNYDPYDSTGGVEDFYYYFFN